MATVSSLTHQSGTCQPCWGVQVTLTSSRSGKFESKFYHKVYAEEFGTVRT